MTISELTRAAVAFTFVYAVAFIIVFHSARWL